MKEAFEALLKNVAELFKVKSLVTLSLTAVLIVMLCGVFTPAQEFVTLYCTAYGAIITYFFTKGEKKAEKKTEVVEDYPEQTPGE